MALPMATLVPAASADRPAPQAIVVQATFQYNYREIENLQTRNLWPYPTHDHFQTVAYSPDGNWAIIGGSHDTVFLWDAANRTAQLLNNGTLGNLWGAAWSGDSSKAILVGFGGVLLEFNGGILTQLAPHNNTTWTSAAWFPGRGFLVVGTGGAMFFLDGAARTDINSTVGEHLLGVAYDPVTGTALAVGWFGTAVSVDANGTAAQVASPVAAELRAVSFESDTGVGYVVGSGAALLKYSNGSLVNETHPAIVGDFFDAASLSSATASAFAVRNSSVDGSVLFHNATFDNYVQLGFGGSGMDAVAFSPTEGYALVAGHYGALMIVWPNGTVQSISTATRPSLSDVAWSPDGAVALFVGNNGTVVRYLPATQNVTKLSSPSSSAILRGVSWAPNGTQALIAGQNMLWRYYRATNSFEPLLISGLQDFYDVAWQPNGTVAVLVAASGYIGTFDGTSLTRHTSTSLFNTFYTVKWHVNGAGTGDYAYAGGANIIAKFVPASTVTTSTVLGNFFGVGFEADNVWAVGVDRKIQFYDSNTGTWSERLLPAWIGNVTFRALAATPRGDRLLLVGNQSFTAYLNSSGVNRFDAGYLAGYVGADYNPATGDPLLVGSLSMAFTMKEGTFPNLPPFVQLTSPANGSNWTTADTIGFSAGDSYDPDDDPLTFTWWDNTTGFITTGPSFGAQMGAGNHTVTVFVTDGRGHNESASVSFHVSEMQYAPIVVLSSPNANLNYKDDQDITFDAAGSFDPNINDTISFAWRSNLDGVIGSASVVVARLSTGTHLVTLTVSDDTGLSTNRTLTLTVMAGNRAPILRVGSPEEGVLYYANVPMTFDAQNSSDPDSASFTVRWYVDGLEVGDGLLLTRSLGVGTHRVDVTATDGLKSSTLSLNVSVSAPINLPPRFASVSPANGTVLSGTATLNGSVEADAAGPVQYVDISIEGGPRLRALWSSPANLTWSLAVNTQDYGDRPIEVTFFAFDGSLTTQTTRTYTISNPFVNTAPTLVVLSPRAGTTLRGLFTLAGTIDDPDAQNLSVEYRIVGGDWHEAIVTSSTWSAPIESAQLPNGPVTLEVRAFDQVTYSEVATLTVIVDNPADTGGFLPGPGAPAAALAIAGAAVLLIARNRRGRP